MSADPPAFRDDFVSEWDRCIYLLEQLAYCFWKADEDLEARKYAERLEPVLDRIDPLGTTQRGAEAWALIRACRADWPRCLSAKRHEIDVMRHLLAERIAPEVVNGQDLVVAAEEYLLLARAADEPKSGSSLISELIRDGMLEPKQVRFLEERLAQILGKLAETCASTRARRPP